MAEQEAEEEAEVQAAEGGGTGRGSRSGTRYPFFDLEQSERFARFVQEAGGNEVLEADLLKYMKLSSSTKSWIYGLSTAKEFGLIERKGQKAQARILLTDLAKRLLMPGDNAELMASRAAAFLTPAIYRKLFERYRGAPIPKVEFLANVLVREHKLLESVASTAAQAFIDSAKFSGMATGNAFNNDNGSKATTPPEEKASPDGEHPPAVNARGSQQVIPVSADFDIYTFPLRRDLTVSIPLPKALTEKDVGRLKKWLDTLVFEEEVKTP